MENPESLLNNIVETENLLVNANPSQPSQTGNENPCDYPQEHKEKHKIEFEKWLNNKYNGELTTETTEVVTSYVMKFAEYEFIRDVLKGIKKITDASQKLDFKRKHYSLIDNRVVRSIKVKAKETFRVETKKVVYLEEFFEILYDAHCIKRFHQGISKTYEYVSSQYYGIPKIVVVTFLKYCYICDLNMKQKSQPRLDPIHSNAPFERVQIDLIDMRNQPDGEWNWIAHMEDHNLQYHVLWPQKKKEGYYYFFFSLSLSFSYSCMYVILIKFFFSHSLL